MSIEQLSDIELEDLSIEASIRYFDTLDPSDAAEYQQLTEERERRFREADIKHRALGSCSCCERDAAGFVIDSPTDGFMEVLSLE